MGDIGFSESRKMETGISGVFLQPLAIIPAEGGPVLHMLRSGYALMPEAGAQFGEIYFSQVDTGAVKAWKLHKRQNQLFAVPMGKIRIVLYDGRSCSPSCGQKAVLELGRPDAYFLLSIPACIWYGFAGISAGPALICNYASVAHDPEEAERLPPDSPLIPYSWQTGLKL